jgi:hypothetical protein
MRIEPEYITSREGERLLNTTRQMFFYYVQTGKIRKIPGETPRKTLYNREDILRLRAESKDESKSNGAIVDWVKITDLPNTLALDILVYDEPVIGDFTLYLSWLRKNPHITLAAFEAEHRDKVLSYINMLPLPESVIVSILKGERDEKTITAKEIENFSRDGDYFLLAESAVTRPGHPEYLGEVMHKFTEYWCNLGPQKKLKRIYAQAATDEGLFLIQKLFFAPLYNFPDDAYVLDLERKNPSRTIRQYQKCIASKGK